MPASRWLAPLPLCLRDFRVRPTHFHCAVLLKEAISLRCGEHARALGLSRSRLTMRWASCVAMLPLHPADMGACSHHTPSVTRIVLTIAGQSPAAIGPAHFLRLRRLIEPSGVQGLSGADCSKLQRHVVIAMVIRVVAEVLAPKALLMQLCEWQF